MPSSAFLFFPLTLPFRLEMDLRARITMLPKNVDSPTWWDPELHDMAISREYRLLLQVGCVTLLPIRSGLAAVFQIRNMSQIQQRCKDYSAVTGYSLNDHYSIIVFTAMVWSGCEISRKLHAQGREKTGSETTRGIES